MPTPPRGQQLSARTRGRFLATYAQLLSYGCDKARIPPFQTAKTITIPTHTYQGQISTIRYRTARFIVNLSYHELAGTQGFEPRYLAPEARVLPLNDVPILLLGYFFHPKQRVFRSKLFQSIFLIDTVLGVLSGCVRLCEWQRDNEVLFQLHGTTISFSITSSLLRMTNFFTGSPARRQ